MRSHLSMVMLQKVKWFTKEVLIKNRLSHQLKAEVHLLDHIFQVLMVIQKVNWVKQMFNDLMRIWEPKGQNLRCLSIRYSLNQRVKLHPKLAARSQAFSPHYPSNRLSNGKLRILKMHRLKFVKTLFYKKNMMLDQKKNQLISMKLKISWHQFLRSSQLPVRLVKCLARHIFHNFSIN